MLKGTAGHTCVVCLCVCVCVCVCVLYMLLSEKLIHSGESPQTAELFSSSVQVLVTSGPPLVSSGLVSSGPPLVSSGLVSSEPRLVSSGLVTSGPPLGWSPLDLLWSPLVLVSSGPPLVRVPLFVSGPSSPLRYFFG